MVRQGRITWIGPTSTARLPIHANVIEGKGRYLMPGLVDMHVHLWDVNDFSLFLANGVTSVRNMFGGPLHLMWMKNIASDQMLGPNLYTTGPIVDGAISPSRF